jgi:hypothetical protein
MFRTSLPADGGMIFPFAKPRIGSFWMKNTLIPLDMFFIRADGSIDRIAENTIPESLEPVVSGGEVSRGARTCGRHGGKAWHRRDRQDHVERYEIAVTRAVCGLRTALPCL